MRITEVKALPGHRLQLRFDNGESGVVDVASYVGRGVFAAWQDPAVFERVHITSEGALEWPGGIDLCPDSLYLRMTQKQPEELFPSINRRLSHA